MPTTINVGLSRKISTANYGSLGASCNVEFEAEHGLLDTDLQSFHALVKNAFTACRQAVQDELSRQTSAQPAISSNGAAATEPSNAAPGTTGNGNGRRQGNGNRRPNGRKATASQVRAIHAIINRQGLDLVQTLRDRCSVEFAEDLGIAQASQLIDDLKGATNGAGGHR
jgi:hypothetical protein